MIANPDALLHKMREAEAIYKRLSSRINNPPPRIIVRTRRLPLAVARLFSNGGLQMSQMGGYRCHKWGVTDVIDGGLQMS
eukprot:3325867-Pyramimonas_sp.AAC.3